MENIVNEYIQNYDSFNKKIIYDFSIGTGGIGDLIKFFMTLLDVCIKNDIQIYYLINNIPIEKYLKMKYSRFYIKEEDITEETDNITNINDLHIMKPNIYYFIRPKIFYNTNTLYKLNIPFNNIFYFSDEVLIKASQIEILSKINNYISIHLRLGDKYLETDKIFIHCLHDTREYSEEKIFKFIEDNCNKNIFFFCDNNSYKLKIKNKYTNILISNFEVCHTGLKNTTETQVLDTITEFYIMTNSQSIYFASRSGFSVTAAKFNVIPLLKI